MIVFGGIAGGAVIAMLYELQAYGGGAGGLPIPLFLSSFGTSALVFTVAAAIGASWRLR